MKKLICFISLILFTATCINAQNDNYPILTGQYLGQKPPGMTPEIFAPGFVSTGMTEGSITFTSDGKECYWTLHPSGFETILMSKVKDGGWTKPEVAPFSGKYLEGFPSMHPDGSKLYFHSFRPTGDKSQYPARLNIWYVERDGDTWSKPKIVESPVNGVGNSACPSVAKSGNLYFSKRYPDGDELIVRSKYINGKYQELEQLSEKVNTTNANFHACIAPDEGYLVIPRDGRRDLIGANWNYYVTFRDENDNWSELKNLGYLINNSRTMITPSLSSDGKYFFFEAKSPEVYFDSLDTKFNLVEFMEKEIQYPVNSGKDIYWISTDYLKKIESLKYTNIVYGLTETLKEEGIDALIALYRDLKKKYPDFYDFSEPMLNNLGYQLLGGGHDENAIKVFQLNAEAFPDSWNVYDSLAEAYMKKGEIEKAIINYQKSLELNPGNDNAREQIEELKQKI